VCRYGSARPSSRKTEIIRKHHVRCGGGSTSVTRARTFVHEQYRDALPFASVDVGSELDAGATQRVHA
jgi:hypothetical protein